MTKLIWALIFASITVAFGNDECQNAIGNENILQKLSDLCLKCERTHKKYNLVNRCREGCFQNFDFLACVTKLEGQDEMEYYRRRVEILSGNDLHFNEYYEYLQNPDSILEVSQTMESANRSITEALMETRFWSIPEARNMKESVTPTYELKDTYNTYIEKLWALAEINPDQICAFEAYNNFAESLGTYMVSAEEYERKFADLISAQTTFLKKPSKEILEKLFDQKMTLTYCKRNFAGVLWYKKVCADSVESEMKIIKGDIAVLQRNWVSMIEVSSSQAEVHQMALNYLRKNFNDTKEKMRVCEKNNVI